MFLSFLVSIFVCSLSYGLEHSIESCLKEENKELLSNYIDCSASLNDISSCSKKDKLNETFDCLQKEKSNRQKRKKICPIVAKEISKVCFQYIKKVKESKRNSKLKELYKHLYSIWSEKSQRTRDADSNNIIAFSNANKVYYSFVRHTHTSLVLRAQYYAKKIEDIIKKFNQDVKAPLADKKEAVDRYRELLSKLVELKQEKIDLMSSDYHLHKEKTRKKLYAQRNMGPYAVFLIGLLDEYDAYLGPLNTLNKKLLNSIKEITAKLSLLEKDIRKKTKMDIYVENIKRVRNLLDKKTSNKELERELDYYLSLCEKSSGPSVDCKVLGGLK